VDAQPVASNPIAPESSSITFTGTKPVGTHTGVFKIQEGQLFADKNTITGGKFVIDMNSLQIQDNDTSYKAKLTGHLLSPDFFDVSKYPQARFEITGCTVLNGDSTATHTIQGNLTMKDITKNVSFPAKLTFDDSTVTATANFIIDRTLWGVHYGNDKSLKDKFIYPEVKIALNLKGKRS